MQVEIFAFTSQSIHTYHITTLYQFRGCDTEDDGGGGGGCGWRVREHKQADSYDDGRGATPIPRNTSAGRLIANERQEGRKASDKFAQRRAPIQGARFDPIQIFGQGIEVRPPQNTAYMESYIQSGSFVGVTCPVRPPFQVVTVSRHKYSDQLV